jgi:NTP pyrophosphatase (non-canonical NTP hydrolase)
MSKQVDINNYLNFVDTLTSLASKDHAAYIRRLEELKTQGCDITRLDTAISGLMAESGEAMEILKKMKFQSKEWNEDIRFHLKREAGDIIFYWINLCIALGYTPSEIIAENVEKLKARYPGGEFDPYYSENRKPGDL